MSERDDAIRTIRDCSYEIRQFSCQQTARELANKIIDAINKLAEEWKPYINQAEAAEWHTRLIAEEAENKELRAKLAVEPSEDALEFAFKILAIFGEASTPGYHFFIMPGQPGTKEAEAFIAARDERIRAEALREAMERMCVACTEKTTGHMCADEIKARCPSRAAILAPKEAHDDGHS